MLRINEPLFLNELRRLAGLECWAVIAGAGSGSRVALDFGSKVERDKPLLNPTVADVSRFYKGEFSLFIEDCAWRLEQGGAIICSSKSDNRQGAELLHGVSLIVGNKLLRVAAIAPGWDLVMEFEGGFVLRTFSDCVTQDDGDNFTLYTPESVVSIGAKGEMRKER